MTMFAAAFALLAAATISSPKVGVFFARPDWMPREVESRDTVGSADTYWPWEEVWTNYNRVTHFFTPRRIGSNETASVYALLESMMERQYAVCAGDAPCTDPAFGPVGESHFDFRIFAFRDYGYPVKAPDGVFVYDPPQRTNQYVETCVLTGQTVVVTNTVPGTDHTNRTAYLRFAEGNNLVRMRQAFTNWLNDGMGPFGDPMRPATNAAGVVTGWSGGAHFTTVAPFDAPDFDIYGELPFDGEPFFDFAPELVGAMTDAQEARGYVRRKPGYYFAATADLAPDDDGIYPPICLADELLTGADGRIHPWFKRGVPVIDWQRRFAYRDAVPLYPAIGFDDITACAAMASGDGDAAVPRFGTGIGGTVLDPSVADAIASPVRRLWSDEIAGMNQRLSMLDTAVKKCDDILPAPCAVINRSEMKCIRSVLNLGHGYYDGFSGRYEITDFDRDVESETNIVFNGVVAQSDFKAHVLLYRDVPQMAFSEDSYASTGYSTAPRFNDGSEIEAVLESYFSWYSLRGKSFVLSFDNSYLAPYYYTELITDTGSDTDYVEWGSPGINDSGVSLYYSAAVQRWVEAHLTTNFYHRVTPTWPGQIAKDILPDMETSDIAMFGIARRLADHMQYPDECVMNGDEASAEVYWSIGQASQAWRGIGGKTREDVLTEDLRELLECFKRDHKNCNCGVDYDDIEGMTQDPMRDVSEIFYDVRKQFWPTSIDMFVHEENAHRETYICHMDEHGFVTVDRMEFTPGTGTMEAVDDIVKHGQYDDPFAGELDAYQIDAMVRIGTAAKFNFNTLRRKDD